MTNPARLPPALIRLLGGLLLLLLLDACSITRIVPLQIGRINQTDTFTQKFSFLDNLSSGTEADQPMSDQRLFAGTRKMDETFSLMLGEKNWQNIKDLYGLGNLRQELLDKDIYLRGFTNINIYPDPFDADRFSVDGFGRYFMIREKNGAILLTGDYYFSDQQQSISALEKGYLILSANLYLIKIPGLVTYYHEAPIKYKIFIDTSLAAQRIYSIDYRKKHLAYLVEEDEELENQAPFARISLTPPSRQEKLWDLRGIQFMRRDYQQLLETVRD